MAGKNAFKRLFMAGSDDITLTRAQFAAFAPLVPLLYLTLIINAVFLVYAFYGEAPSLLTVIVPSLLCGICGTRFFYWLYRIRKPFSDDETKKYIRQFHNAAIMLSVMFAGWALALFPYGNAYAKSQIAYYMTVTMITCVFCFMYLNSAAKLIALIVTTPIVLFFLFFQEQPNLRSTAMNFILATGITIFMVRKYYRDFAHLVESRKSLQEKQLETQRLSDENYRIANRDALTGLNNRRRFFVDLESLILESRNSRRTCAVGVLDLDGFKPINDSHGHAAGDAALIEVARRLEFVCPRDVSLFRLGGDEFAVLCMGACDDASLNALGRAMTGVLANPFHHDGNALILGGSMGFAVYPAAADTAEALYECADYALYHAKRARRGETVLFTHAHQEEIRSATRVELALKHADFGRDMSLEFQPIIDARSNRPLAFEALARWVSPSIGAVSPAVFIPVAERTGLMRQLTLALLQKALKAAARWPQAIHLSFNLSAKDLCDSGTITQVMAAIHASGIDPKRVDFEITETALMHNIDEALAGLTALRALGVGIALDDFGTGYSSLSYIRSLPLDKIKLDRSFIANGVVDENNFRIVRFLQALCSDMHIDCVMEGVEDEAQRDALSDLGCHLMQGYYFARPMPESAIAPYLASLGKSGEASFMAQAI